MRILFIRNLVNYLGVYTLKLSLDGWSVDECRRSARPRQGFVFLSALMDGPCEQVYSPLCQGQSSVECW